MRGVLQEGENAFFAATKGTFNGPIWNPKHQRHIDNYKFVHPNHQL